MGRPSSDEVLEQARQATWVKQYALVNPSQPTMWRISYDVQEGHSIIADKLLLCETLPGLIMKCQLALGASGDAYNAWSRKTLWLNTRLETTCDDAMPGGLDRCGY
jgi:hypothetical protein